MRGRAYLAACTIYRDAADYLAEWVEFHRLMGVERFFLYDNDSQDHHLDVLAPYRQDGVVVSHEWPFPFLGRRGRPRAILTAFEHCASAHADDARWISFLDIDEFVFAPQHPGLPQVLAGYEEFPGVVVSRAEFGPSGHVTKPEGLVIENYVQRRRVRPDEEGWFKTIADPRRVTRCLGAHGFAYRDGLPVDEDRRPIDPRRFEHRKPVAWERLRVHHYWSRSEEERLRKAQMWQQPGSPRRVPATPVPAGRQSVRDETLVAYAPAVREALAKRAQATA